MMSEDFNFLLFGTYGLITCVISMTFDDLLTALTFSLVDNLLHWSHAVINLTGKTQL